MNIGDVTRKTLEWALERVPRVDGDIVEQIEARQAEEEAERARNEDEKSALALAWQMTQKARAKAEALAREAEIRLDEARRNGGEGAAAAKELLARDDARRERQRKHGRKGGGQPKDNKDARDALRKLLATWAKDPEKKKWTQEKLIKEAKKAVNRNREQRGKPGGLACNWESYRFLLPPSRRRKHKEK